MKECNRLHARFHLGLRATTALGLAVLAAPPAWAQEGDEAAVPPTVLPGQASAKLDNQADNSIVVTASRTARNGLDAPTPTQIVDSEVLDRQAATTVMEVLNQNPAFKATRSPGANATNVASPGQATADLRALGGQRTLVLVNGARIVPFAPASNRSVPTTTDLNLIPTMMIDRVDVVTGGASALYGSDAVSGVVNLIMKTSYDGIDARVQTGISERGDYRTFRAGFVAGSDFADGRGNVVISADYSDNTGVGDIYTRGWGRREQLIIPIGGGNQLLTDNVRQQLGIGGVIVGGADALIDYTFNDDLSIRPFDRGSPTAGRVMVGGEGQSLIKGTSLVPPVERFTAYGSIYFDFSDSVTGYIEGGWAKATGSLEGVPIRLTRQVIANDNPYIPDAVRAELGGNDLFISKYAYDFGLNQYAVTNETPHGTIGLRGELGDNWRWDAHATYGINYYRQRGTQLPITQNLAFALDAVDEGAFLNNAPNGNIVCRAVAAGNPDAAGCAPLNFFGRNNFSEAAREYVFGENFADVKYTQFTAAANIVGDVFTLPAGPVTVAVGGEYRKETQKLTSDPIAQQNGYLGSGNAIPYSGKFDVIEGYTEATVPVFSMLDLNGAIRYADYSTAGGQVTWKLGGVFTPIEGLNLRVARSRDIRAPAINELASPGNNVFATVALKGKVNAIPANSTRGNPDVGPEKADTWTAGLAYRGSGALSGFGASIDYYNIKINDAIANPSAAQVAQLCDDGQQYFCDQFTYGPDPENPGEQIHTALVSGTLNLGSFEQEGIDITLNYRTNVGFLGASGRYSIGGSGTYVLHSIVDPGVVGAVAQDNAGAHNPYTLGAIPDFRGNITQTLGNDSFEVSLQTIYISSGVQDYAFEGKINDNSVPSVTYFNAFGKFFAGSGKRFEFFWAINNLFDKDPAITPYYILNAPVNGQYYDKVGRNYMAGIRIRM
ncbi:TonB-dependent receptor plug domain-containing protein [Novosphingobium aquimarinum]|uniref:TonB-dependent receptor plug domain-containing protein n=1 Tax=Novosphingobium aquimarinum TaxID=2682494 RepID=UPI0012EC9AB1|nr:TonB-dependent receptor [Novosphingobium aquimarinum]